MKITNLPRLSKGEIESTSIKVLHHFNPNYFERITPTPLFRIIDNLVSAKYLEYDDSSRLGFAHDNSQILGCYLPLKKKIMVNSNLKQDSPKMKFVVAHELGHFVLHRNLVLDDTNSTSLIDSEGEILFAKKKLVTPNDFMEWQANYFASVILLPKDTLIAKLAMVREELGLRWRERIFLDDQRCNIQDYFATLSQLQEFFGVSKTVIEIRLTELKLVDDRRRKPTHVSEIFESLMNEIINARK